jgi:hypothetical protein
MHYGGIKNISGRKPPDNAWNMELGLKNKKKVLT